MQEPRLATNSSVGVGPASPPPSATGWSSTRWWPRTSRVNRVPSTWRVVITPASMSGEDDLAAGSLLVELADGDDVADLGDEVVLLQAEQVDRCLAGVQARAGVGDHLDELRDGGDVEL